MIMPNVSTTVWLSSSVAVQTEGDSPYTVQATDKDNHVDVETFGSIIIQVLADEVHSTCPYLPSHKGFFSCVCSMYVHSQLHTDKLDFDVGSCNVYIHM